MTASALVRAGQFNQAARQGAYILIALALPRLGVPRELIGEWETLLFLATSSASAGRRVYSRAFWSRWERSQTGPVSYLPGGRYRSWRVSRPVFCCWLRCCTMPFFTVLQIEQAPVGWHLFFVLLLSRWPSYCFEQALLLQGHARMLIVYAVLNSLGLLAALLVPLYLGYPFLQAVQILGAFAVQR